MSWLAYAKAAKELAPYAKAIGNAAESVASLNNDSGSESGSNMNVGTTDNTPQYNTTPSYNTASAIKSAATTHASDTNQDIPESQQKESHKVSLPSSVLQQAYDVQTKMAANQGNAGTQQRTLDTMLNPYKIETPEEKKARERAEFNSNLISGLGDAISGFVGLGFAANGGQALNTNGKTALGGKLEEQEKKRQERKSEMEKYYTYQKDIYNQALAEMARKRKEQQEAELRPYQLRKAEADANTAEYNSQVAKSKANFADATNKSIIDKNNRVGTRVTGAVKKNSKGDMEIPTNDGSYTIPKNSYKAVMSAAYHDIPPTFNSSYVKRNQYDEEYRDVNKYDQIVMEYMKSPESVGDVTFWSHFGNYKTNSASNGTSGKVSRQLPGNNKKVKDKTEEKQNQEEVLPL